MKENTVKSGKEILDEFIKAMITISNEAKNNPESLKSAPHNTPISRTDDAMAVRRPILTYDDELKLTNELNYHEKDINF